MNKKSKLLIFLSIFTTQLSFSSNIATSQGIRLASSTLRTASGKVATTASPMLVAPTLREHKETLGIYSEEPTKSEIDNALQENLFYFQGNPEKHDQFIEAHKALLNSRQPTEINQQLTRPKISYQNLGEVINAAKKHIVTKEEATNLFNTLIRQGNYSSASFFYTNISDLHLISTKDLDKALQESVDNENFSLIESLHFDNNRLIGTHDKYLQKKLEEKTDSLIRNLLISKNYTELEKIIKSQVPSINTITEELKYELDQSKQDPQAIKILLETPNLPKETIKNAFMKASESIKYEIVEKLNQNDSEKLFEQSSKEGNEEAMRVLWKTGKVSDYTAKKMYEYAQKTKNDTLLGTLRRVTQRPDSDFKEGFFSRAAKYGAAGATAFTLAPEEKWDVGIATTHKAKGILSKSINDFKLGGATALTQGSYKEHPMIGIAREQFEKQQRLALQAKHTAKHENTQDEYMRWHTGE